MDNQRADSQLDEDEAMLVATVRAFIDRDVRPSVREVEHANTYPQAQGTGVVD
ncbi:hypothetical protein OSJ20_11255 [Mycobacterium ulcerans]|uniref:hypothetical protein n=1 Tax=Mycobacterium ulcerans TaxID=1809 RepID=UPI00031A313A|nr:hypothetical protein [Mycobacterium ulcerans]MEB3909755.1 hypothetical protein [Mycobacterium ulcerans]MEB3920018.1 hypothetical protein [Mycobacterium ulcerans]MEB3928306.1 hypothetical protein [Mycobacterium ulcerans]MEB3936517.1 hypothetical protein [Mycobacterium ulcerans]MEB3946798.1 hypothetical protein [Mycobacterium ulcerans]